MFWYTQYKKRKEAESRAAKKRYHDREKLAEIDIQKATEAMLKKRCPLSNSACGMGTCFKGCVHFQEGSIFYELPYPGSGLSGHWVREYPKCKLWAKE